MTKTTFYAACRANNRVEFKQMTGYEDFFMASDGTPIELIFHRSINYGPNSWTITERETGLNCNEYAPTRKELLTRCTAEFIDKCAAALKSDFCAKLRNDLADFILREGVTI